MTKKTIPITDFLQALHRLEDRANQCIAVNGNNFKKKNLFKIFQIFFLVVFEAQSQNLSDTLCIGCSLSSLP